MSKYQNIINYPYINALHHYSSKTKEDSYTSLLCLLIPFFEYIKLDRDKSTFKSHRDFSSEKEITFKHL